MNSYNTFMAAVRGIPTHHVMQALTVLAGVTDWRNSSKALAAEAYAYENRTHTPLQMYSYLRNLDLDRLARMARARKAGDHNWQFTK